MLCVVRTFDDVSLLKDDTGKGGWVNVVDEGCKCRVQLLRDATDDRLILVFKQKAPESNYKEFYRAAVTEDMTIKKLRDDFIQTQITTGVIFGVKFKDKDFVSPDHFLVEFKNTKARVIEQVTQSLAVDQRPKQPVQDFHTMAPTPTHRDIIGYQEQRRYTNQAPPPQPQQNVGQNWSGNQQQQQQQQQQQMMQPLDGRHRDMAPMGGAQHAPQYGRGGAPGGGAQRQSGELRSPPINQPQHNAFPMARNQQVGGSHWSGNQQSTPVQAWSENRRHSSETSQPQSPLKKSEPVKPTPAKKAPIISEKQLENYIRLLEAALHDSDKEYTKTIVKLLVEAKEQQKNFSISFPNTDPNNMKTYFRLKVTIEREIAPREQGIPFYYMVTKDFTIEQLKLMFETRFSISPEQQHWIIGSKFATKKDARLTDFGLNGRGSEVHLFISKGEVGDAPSDDDHVTHSDPHHQQPWNPNQPHNLQYNMGPSPRGWQGGPHVQDPVYQNYNNNQPPYDQYYGATGGQQFGNGNGQRFGGNNFTPEGMTVPPRLPSPPPPPRPATPPPPPGWKCTFCSATNKPYRPGCQLCSSNRPADYKPPPGYQPTEEERKWLQDEVLGKQGLEELEKQQRELQERQARENYEAMMAVAKKSLVPNDEEFECPICFIPIEVGQGVKLRECLHNCCKDCLHDHILASADADVLCPCNDQFACGGSITEAEMRELLDDEELDKVHSRGLNLAEGQSRSYHCKTPDCKGWCIYEDDVNEFSCMVCGKKNCLLCKAIHTPQTCKEYQEDLRIKAANDKAAQETQKMIEDMVKNGEAMYCPNQNCGLIIQKKNGCDWIRCSCRTEICWVTKGPRWGPKGHGDKSGGCQCKIGGKKCHPKCGNCH